MQSLSFDLNYEGNSERLSDLLQDLYRYYPIGIPNFKEYAGYKEIKNIIDNKFLNECNNPESLSNQFAKEIQIRLPEQNIQNSNNLYFPNYLVFCPILLKEYSHIRHNCYLEICISLLCKYYTLIFIDQYSFRDFSSPNEFDTVYENYSFQKSRARVEDSFLRIVFEEMARFFPQKEFISHYILCKSCLTECVPFGEEWSPNPAQNTYNLYQLLFHYRGGHIKPRILE